MHALMRLHMRIPCNAEHNLRLARKGKRIQYYTKLGAAIFNCVENKYLFSFHHCCSSVNLDSLHQ